MSRIGKQLITVPDGIEITLNGNQIKVKGKNGELEYTFSPLIDVSCDNGAITVTRNSDDSEAKSLHGLVRALINNMVLGVSSGFQKKLQIVGVGYRAQINGRKMVLNLGFSHPIELDIPEGVNADMDKEQKNTIVISGIDKQSVGQFAANIRSFRPPEPYKGKGIRYSDEYVARKAGKTASKE